MAVLKISLILYITVSSVCYAKQPNIVLILADDLGYNDVGYRGSNQIPTPNIDAIAYNGVVLNRYYTMPTCTPSRAALLTGNYPIRSGMQGIPLRAGENRMLPPEMPTLPERLKELGYTTHLVGKWHLGYGYRTATPTGRGFDSHFGYWNGYMGYFDHMTLEGSFNGLDLHDNFVPAWSYNGSYATDLFTAKSVNIIEQHNTSRPLFLMLSHLAPHTGRSQGPDDTVLEVKDPVQMNKTFSYVQDLNRRQYVDIVKGVDHSVGELIEALANKGILDNTIVLFTSDNGGQTEGLHANYASNWPLRGLKFTYFEGAIRGTAVLYNEKLLFKGFINDNLMHITDWLPTFYAAGGGNVKDLGDIDGINQWKTLQYNKVTKRKDLLINIDERNNIDGIISHRGRYKLINGTIFDGIYDAYYGDPGRATANPPYNFRAVLNSGTNEALRKFRGTRLNNFKALRLRSSMDISYCRTADETPSVNCNHYCLFDLYKDPCETTNIANSHPDIVEELKRKLDKYRSQLVPQQNTIVDPNSNPALYNGVWSTWLEPHPL